jgi:signal transduction histidine kinase
VRAVLAAAAPLLGQVTALHLVEADRLRLAGVDGSDPQLVEALRAHLGTRSVRIGEGIAGGAAATATSFVAGGGSPPPAFPGDPDGVTALGLRSIAAVPIVSRAIVRGILVSGSKAPSALGEGERRLAEAIAERAGPALENATLWADLQDQVVREQQAQHIKDDFLSIVSHELRTPLTSIQGYSQLLEARLRGVTDGNAKERSHLRIIRSQVGRMRRLVDDLLDVSRIDKRGGVSIEPASFDLVEELREVVARTRREHPNRDIALEAPAAMPVEADRDRIAQVLTNLTDNAVKYSPEGGPIRIRARADRASAHVSVSDEGIGVTAEHLDLVFERFYQADDEVSRRRFGGLGLGLYISRAIIEAHGGSMAAAPNREAGRGTVFSFRIPVRSVTRLSPLSPEPPAFVVRRREPVE